MSYGALGPKQAASDQAQRREIETAPVDRVTENATLVLRPSRWPLSSGQGPYACGACNALPRLTPQLTVSPADEIVERRLLAYCAPLESV